MQNAWRSYIKKLQKNGKKILASIMETDTPTVKDHQLMIDLPNETMRRELQTIERDLMRFIRETIHNSKIELIINVEESIQKKYAFTKQEKFEKLKEKNPLIDRLRSDFDLEI